MIEKSISLDFKLRKIDETKNDFIEEIKHRDLMSKKHNNVCTDLNYIEQLFILVSAVTGCVSVWVLASLAAISIDIASSALVLKIYGIIAGIKKCKSIINKKRTKQWFIEKFKLYHIWYHKWYHINWSVEKNRN